MSEKKKENKFLSLFKSDASTSFISSAICIAIGLVAGLLIMILISLINPDNNISQAFAGLKIMLLGPFSSVKYAKVEFGNMIFYSVPLIFTGLSVAIAYKTGLFNIGAPGQYVMGTLGATITALYLPTTSRAEGVLVWALALLVGTLCGALWGLIPGLLKAFLNINEVIICIMTNWIAANISSWLLKYCTAIQSTENTKAGYLKKVVDNYTPKMGMDKLFPSSMADGGIFIAIIAAIVIYIILNKTTFGFELKACGANKDASKYAGLNEKRNIVLSMVIAGALAGMGASLYYLNPSIEYRYIAQYASLPSYGFNGIASAFLANCNPIGTIFSSILIRYLNVGGSYLTKVNFNRYVADVVVAVIIYMAGFSRIFKELIKGRENKKERSNIKREGEKKEEKVNE